MPIINDTPVSNYAWAPTSIFGLVPNAVSTDADSLREEERITFEHLSQSLDSAFELFSALTFIAQKGPMPPAIFRVLLAALEKLYRFDSSDELNIFLCEHSELAMALFGIYRGIKNYFPGNLTLRVLPRGDDASLPQLVLRAHTHMSPQDARRVIMDFRREWWRQHYEPCFKDLTVSLEFP